MSRIVMLSATERLLKNVTTRERTYLHPPLKKIADRTTEARARKRTYCLQVELKQGGKC